jgi:hypothetical protein
MKGLVSPFGFGCARRPPGSTTHDNKLLTHVISSLKENIVIEQKKNPGPGMVSLLEVFHVLTERF